MRQTSRPIIIQRQYTTNSPTPHANECCIIPPPPPPVQNHIRILTPTRPAPPHPQRPLNFHSTSTQLPLRHTPIHSTSAQLPLNNHPLCTRPLNFHSASTLPLNIHSTSTQLRTRPLIHSTSTQRPLKYSHFHSTSTQLPLNFHSTPHPSHPSPRKRHPLNMGCGVKSIASTFPLPL